MTDEALAECRADVASGSRDQLAQDVTDLLDEVANLRFLVRCLVDARNVT